MFHRGVFLALAATVHLQQLIKPLACQFQKIAIVDCVLHVTIMLD
jgi:hypothetical protein